MTPLLYCDCHILRISTKLAVKFMSREATADISAVSQPFAGGDATIKPLCHANKVNTEAVY